MIGVDDDWMVAATCSGINPQTFYPTDTSDEYAAATIEAYCDRCPVMGECLDYALITNQEHGIWGGMAEDKRRRVRRAWLARQRS